MNSLQSLNRNNNKKRKSKQSRKDGSSKTAFKSCESRPNEQQPNNENQASNITIVENQQQVNENKQRKKYKSNETSHLQAVQRGRPKSKSSMNVYSLNNNTPNTMEELKKKFEQEHLMRTIAFFEKDQQLATASYQNQKSEKPSKQNASSISKPRTRKKAKQPKTRNKKEIKTKRSAKPISVSLAQSKSSKQAKRCKSEVFGDNLMDNEKILEKISEKKEKKVKKTRDDTSITKVSNTLPLPADNSQMFLVSENQMIDLIKSFLQMFPKLPAESSKPKVQYTNTSIVEDSEMLEMLNDELNELSTNVKTVKNSYQDIVESLISIQRRPRHRKSKQQLLPETMSQLSTNRKEIVKGSWDPGVDKTNKLLLLEKFMNPKTREDAFNQLFDRVEKLEEEMKYFRAAFTADGALMKEFYLSQNPVQKVTFWQYNRWRDEIRELSKVVDSILQEYNREVLELFRLSQCPSGT